jgi:hypothetical protein
VYNTGGEEKGDVAEKKGYIGLCCGEFLVQGSTCEFCWLRNKIRRSLHLAAPAGTSGTTSLETRFSTRREDSVQHWALLWHLISLLPLRPCASRSKLSSPQLSQLCNHSTRLQTPSGGKCRRNWCHRIENTSLVALRCFFALPTRDFHRETEHIHNLWFEVLFQERVQYNDNRAKKAYTPFKRCK